MQKNTVITLFATACLVATANTTWAAEEEETAQELDTVEVHGTTAKNEPPQSPYHQPESSMSATWSIDQEGIKALKPRSLFDILSYAPGVQLNFQGRKGLNFVSSRGASFIGDSSFAFIIDGVYIPWTQSSRVLDSFPVDIIESIRVIRDSTTLTMAPLASLGGKGSSVQGIIFIKTRKPVKKQSHVKASYGNLNRSKIYLNHENTTENGYYSLNYSRLNDDGRDNWNNASQSDTLFLKGGYDNDAIDIDSSLYYSTGSQEFQRSTSVSKTHSAKWKYDPLSNLMATAQFNKDWDAEDHTSLLLYGGQVKSTTQYRAYNSSSFSETDQEENMFEASLNHIITTEKNNLRLGGQTIFWDCPYGQFYYEGYERKEQLYSGYAYDEYHLLPQWTVDGGARTDLRYIDTGINKYSPTDPTTNVTINDQWSDPYYWVSAGTAYSFNEILKASLRLSFTEQGADSDFLLSEDDETLNPEKQMRYELGMTATFNPALYTTVTGFYYDIKDAKEVVGSLTVNDDVYSIYSNADTARKGMEVEVGGSLLAPDLTYMLSYTYQRSDNDDDDKTMPRHLVSARLGYRINPFQFNLMLRNVGEYESNQFAVGDTYYAIGDFSRIDANISYDFILRNIPMRATLFGQNLTDQEYQTRLGWKDVGRTYGIELEFTF